MTIILFIIILAVLILVHEFGHFIVAKKTGMRVDEFGIGFPPKLFSFKKGETEYSINLIPLGGFVKILGEDPNDEQEENTDNERSMSKKPKWAQALVISAGVIFNLIFAWLLISGGFMSGLPMSVNDYHMGSAKDQNIVILGVKKDSPAAKAGLKVGDKLLFIGTGKDSIQAFSEKQMQDFIASHGGQELSFLYKRGKKNMKASIVPINGIINKPAIGITSSMIGTVKFGFLQSLWEGLKLTASLFISTITGLFYFIVSLVSGTGNLSEITGPVGIVGMVGEAAKFGFVYLLGFTAFISINLAVINLIPFPALDGGRLLFIAIEAVMRKNIKPVIVNTLNLVGFGLLITLMIAVTYNDILKLF